MIKKRIPKMGDNIWMEGWNKAHAHDWHVCEFSDDGRRLSITRPGWVGTPAWYTVDNPWVFGDERQFEGNDDGFVVVCLLQADAESLVEHLDELGAFDDVVDALLDVLP